MSGHFSEIADPWLARTLKDLLYEQQGKVGRMALLAPDLDHLLRVRDNVPRLMANPILGARLREAFGPAAPRVATLAALLSKVGFAHKDLDPGDVTTSFQNRIFALELLIPLKDRLRSELGLDEGAYRAFIEAIVREGTFGEGTQGDTGRLRAASAANARLGSALRAHGFDDGLLAMAEVKFANPLTSLLTLASEIDVSRLRLQEWQRNEAVMRILIDISADPALANLEIEKYNIEQDLMAQRDRAASPDRGRPEDAAIVREDMARVERAVAENRRRFKGHLDAIVRREFIGKEERVKGQLRRGGLDAAAADELFALVASCLAGMTGDSYLWYVGSNSIASVDISADGGTLSVVQTDHTDSFGAAAKLSHLRDFHVDRLGHIVRQVNDSLGADIRLECRDVRRRQELWDRCHALFKGDTHMHLKMSVMAHRVWESLIGPEMEAYEAVFEQSQQLFNRLREKRALPQDVDLIGTFIEANRRAQSLFRFVANHRADYAWPANKDDLPQEARLAFMARSEPLSAADLQRLEEDIRLYYVLKFHTTKLFSFTDGALPEFVDHFTAVSKLLSKISATDERTTLKALTHKMLADAARIGVWYVEPRFNIGGSPEGTLNEVLLVIQARKELRLANPRRPVPLMRIILSITKFADGHRPAEERRLHKIRSAEIFVEMLSSARRRFLEGNHPYEAVGREVPVTPGDVLETLAGIDAAGQEETNAPDLFFEAFRLVDRASREAEMMPSVGMSFHISESIDDVSVESGIRHLFEALFMRPFPEVGPDDVPLLDRVGHAIVVALTDYDRLRGTRRREDLSERIRQVEFDLALCRMGVPLLAVGEETLERERRDLEHFVALGGGSKPDGAASRDPSMAEIAHRWGIDDEGMVTYAYEGEEEIIDLETRAGLARDALIRFDIVVETNPTSNVGVCPFTHDYADHTLRTYLSSTYGSWGRSRRLASALARRAAGGDRGRAAHAREQSRALEDYQKEGLEYHGKKVRVTINTDDGTLFGINLVDEYYRTALALDLSEEAIERLAEESIRSAIRPLPADEVATLRALVGRGVGDLQLPAATAGGLNEFVVDRLRQFSDEVRLDADGPPIIREGEPDDGSFYLVLGGDVLIMIDDRQVATLRQNALFGEMASLTGYRTASVVAGDGGAHLLRVPKSDFIEVCHNDRGVRNYFEELIAARDQSGSFKGFDSHFAPITPEAVGVGGQTPNPPGPIETSG